MERLTNSFTPPFLSADDLRIADLVARNEALRARITCLKTIARRPNPEGVAPCPTPSRT